MAASAPIRLVAGLGNPGRAYERTRHNAGYWFVDALASKLGAAFSHQAKFAGDVARLAFDTVAHDVRRDARCTGHAGRG